MRLTFCLDLSLKFSLYFFVKVGPYTFSSQSMSETVSHEDCNASQYSCADPLALGNPLETISVADRQTD